MRMRKRGKTLQIRDAQSMTDACSSWLRQFGGQWCTACMERQTHLTWIERRKKWRNNMIGLVIEDEWTGTPRLSS